MVEYTNFEPSDEEKALVNEYQKYCKDNHLRCNTYCSLYDTIDKDCEIYGNNKPTISKCGIYFDRWRNKKVLEEKKKKEKHNENIV